MDSLPLPVIFAIFTALLAAVLLQERRIRLLRRRPIVQPAVISGGFSLLEKFPEALIVVAHDGQILFRNTAFEALPGPYGRLEALSQFDRLLGTRLQMRLTGRQRSARFELQLRVASHGKEIERLPYLAVCWPVNVPDAAFGQAICFFPQALSRSRQREYPRLEQQLLAYLTSASSELSRLSSKFESSSTALANIALKSQEMNEISRYLQTLHGPLRTQHPADKLKLKSLTDSSIKEIRPLLRSGALQLISSVSNGLEILGHDDDIELLLGLLLQLALENCTPGGTLRLDARIENGETVLNLEFIPQPGRTTTSLQEMQLALAHQFAAKISGRLDVHSGQYRLFMRTA